MTPPPADFDSEVFIAKGKVFFFAKVPAGLSKSHLRRGRVTARVSVGGSRFDALMEPDGKLGHWFAVPGEVMKAEALTLGIEVSFTLSRLDKQPDPALPEGFKTLLGKSPAAAATWESATTLARIDWVHWIESAKQDATSRERADSAIDMLGKGKKRVCCFDPSGFFSKALALPIQDHE